MLCLLFEFTKTKSNDLLSGLFSIYFLNCFFQYSIPGIFDEQTASLVLRQLIYDGYRDDGTVPAGYKFKVISCMKCMFLMNGSPWLALRSSICQVI